MVLKLRVESPGYWDLAKCGGLTILTGDDPWFEDEPAAMEFCNAPVTCPIREQCLLYAATNNCREGVWGGMTEEDRKIMRKLWPLKGGRVPRPEWRWFTHEELASLLAARIERGEISREQVEEEDDDDEEE